jgi:hypothetical protein
MLTNMFYHVPGESTESDSSTPTFLIDQVDLIGGIEFIFLEVCRSFVMIFEYLVRLAYS